MYLRYWAAFCVALYEFCIWCHGGLVEDFRASRTALPDLQVRLKTHVQRHCVPGRQMVRCPLTCPVAGWPLKPRCCAPAQRALPQDTRTRHSARRTTTSARAHARTKNTRTSRHARTHAPNTAFSDDEAVFASRLVGCRNALLCHSLWSPPRPNHRCLPWRGEH